MFGKEVRIRNDILCLVHAIQMPCFENLGFQEAVVEDSESAADNGLRVVAVAECPRESDSWSEIGVIVNDVLGFVTQPEIE